MEKAEYDLPAAFSYIANITGQKVNYIGHSQGTTIMFAALSLRLQPVVDNLRQFIALGPVTYVENNRSPLAHPYSKLLQELNRLKVNKMLASNKPVSAFSA